MKSWLDKTGYPLELRVAREVENHQPRSVLQSHYYRDRIAGKAREIDVVASWARHNPAYWAWLYLVIECKSKPAPWVIFDANRGETESLTDRWGWMPHLVSVDSLGDGPNVAPREKVRWSDREASLLKPSRVGTNIVEAHRPVNEPNGAWEAVLGAVSAAHGLLAEGPPPGTELGAPSFAVWAMPIVVTSGLLYRSFLKGTELEVQPIERGEVMVPSSHGSGLTRCFIVTESALPRLLADASRTPQIL